MKHIFLLLSLAGMALTYVSCKKDENKIFLEQSTAPVLTASAADVRLEPGEEANTALVLNWTNPNYLFTTGVSSQDVTYTLELDTAGANFTSSKKFTTVIAKELTKSYTVGQLNAILGNDMVLQLDPRRTYNMEMRVTASIGSSAKLSSNVISFSTRPFAPPPKVVTPDAGTLWMVGDAAPSGWSNPLPSPYDVNQKFTRVTSTLYELVVNLPGGGGYKLIQEQGDWGKQYHALSGGSWESGDFEKRDADPTFPGPPTAGTYKITVNFQLGKYSVVRQ